MSANRIQPDQKTEIEWGKDPANYRCGNFYHNKKDERFWVKNWQGYYRGRGWILNFARPYSMVFFIGIIVVSAMIIFGIDWLVNKP
jgi:uncharacterized membrane protein